MGTYELAQGLTPAKNADVALSVNSKSLGVARVNGAAVSKNGVKYAVKASGGKLNLTLSAVAGVLRKGTAASQTLSGSANCDIFYGAAGNDTIKGVNGHDIAVYDNRNWGKDTIIATKGTMTVLFGSIKATDITQTRKGKDLVITRKADKKQTITIKNWTAATHKVAFGGTLGQFNKYLAAARPTAVQQNNARKELWQKSGFLA